MTAYWLLKTEPVEYSWPDLVREGETVWDGVRAPAALKNLARLKPGDLALIYHTGRERSIAGIARVTSFPYHSSAGNGPVFRLVPLEALRRPVTLKEIKESGVFPDWDLLRLPRLSVVPVNRRQWDQVMEWSRS